MKKLLLTLSYVATLVACNQVTEKKECPTEFKDTVVTHIDSAKVDSTLVQDTIFNPEILK